MSEKAFDFGVNWKSYSEHSLDTAKLADAEASLKTLFGAESFAGKNFLDIGCGSGIFSIAAKRMGAAAVTGIDISQASVETSQANARREGFSESELCFTRGDALKPETFSGLGQFDLVYAWGSLHHTGDLWKALSNSLTAVKPGGCFVVAIYRRHWTSPGWTLIKKIYNSSPDWLKRGWIALFYPLIYLAKACLTGQNPMKMHRGMDFYHDVVDWIGGYPYEYASASEVREFLRRAGFIEERFIPSVLPTGNHQYLFRKKDSR